MARVANTDDKKRITNMRLWDNLTDKESIENGMEEQLRDILVDKLKKSVEHFDKVKSAFSGGKENSMHELTLISESYGELKVLIDIVSKSNLFLGYDGDCTNNLSYYRKIEKEALDKRNKIIELYRNQLLWESPHNLNRVQSSLVQSKQTINNETDTVMLSTNELNELVATLKSAINTIQDNAENIVNFKINRERGKKIREEKNYNFNKSVDTNKLYEEYEANGFHLTKEMCERYKKECGITMQGLRNRLIKAEKWNYRKLNDKK